MQGVPHVGLGLDSEADFLVLQRDAHPKILLSTPGPVLCQQAPQLGHKDPRLLRAISLQWESDVNIVSTGHMYLDQGTMTTNSRGATNRNIMYSLALQ